MEGRVGMPLSSIVDQKISKTKRLFRLTFLEIVCLIVVYFEVNSVVVFCQFRFPHEDVFLTGPLFPIVNRLFHSCDRRGQVLFHVLL